MTIVDQATMRDRFHAVTSELLDEDPALAVVVADIGVWGFEQTGALGRHPDRILNVGIREQLMVGFAAGLALEGLRPIVHSYAPFLVERPFEQLKLDFGHQGHGGVFVSIGASYDWAAGGRTHQAPGDVALLSTLPGWRIHVPGHPVEVEPLLRRAAAGSGLDYLRLSAQANARPVATDPDRLAVVRPGRPGAPVVVAVGPMLGRVLAATADRDITVLYATTVRPFDRTGLRAALTSTEVVLIEPYLAGTSAAEISAALSDTPHRLLALGVRGEEHRRYGTAEEHDAAHGLDAAGIRRSITAFLDG
jgi:transketolase